MKLSSERANSKKKKAKIHFRCKKVILYARVRKADSLSKTHLTFLDSKKAVRKCDSLRFPVIRHDLSARSEPFSPYSFKDPPTKSILWFLHNTVHLGLIYQNIKVGIETYAIQAVNDPLIDKIDRASDEL